MRCKTHPSDLSSTLGVCATCLRDRLSRLIAAQAQAQAHQAQQLAQLRSGEDRRKSDHSQPPPLVFPRSVSPYIARRKSDNAASWDNHLRQPHHDYTFSDPRFYSTPQVGPTSASVNSTGSYAKRKSKFSLISSLFRSRSEKSDSDLRFSRDTCTTSPSSSSPSSWLPSIFPVRLKNKSRFFSDDQRPGRTRDRGMSPERTSCDDDDCGRSSGYSSESSGRWKRTPVTAPVTVVRRGRSSHGGMNVSGLAFCLSPLVRASPNRNWTQKALPADIGVPGGEIRVSAKPHLATAASFCANRSRKLADFGRLNNNR